MVLNQYNQEGAPFFFHHSKSYVPGVGCTIGPEVHGQYELLYLIQGNLTYYVEGRKYPVAPGDMILIAPNDIHLLQIVPGAVYERIVFHFNMELLRQAFWELVPVWGDLTRYRRFPVMPEVLCVEYGLTTLLWELVEREEKEPHRKIYTIAKTLELVIGLGKLLSEEQQLPVPASVDPLLQKAAAFLEDHLTEPFCLDAMAKALFVSKSTLCHRFRQGMNMTVNRYVAVKKIRLADELILKGMSATEACQQVGYTGYTTFYYNYKQIMGKAPSQRK